MPDSKVNNEITSGMFSIEAMKYASRSTINRTNDGVANLPNFFQAADIGVQCEYICLIPLKLIFICHWGFQI